VTAPVQGAPAGPSPLSRLTDSEGVEAAFLIDRAGRVIDRSVPWEFDRLRQVAALIAAMHAAGVRLAGGGEGEGRVRFALGAGRQGIHLLPLPAPSDLLLVLLLDRPQESRIPDLVALVLQGLEEAGRPPSAPVRDPAAFEASLEREANAPREPGAPPRPDPRGGDEMTSPWDP
jgi:predicted regulator of Ras-like GTPase activity (Roadblock/LC7/MglB family)